MVDVEPIVRTLRNDAVVMPYLVTCFIVATIALGQTRGYLIREIKAFPYPRNYANFFCSTTEMNFRFILCIHTVAILALLLYIEFGQHSLWLYLGYAAGYMLLRYTLYALTNWTFFTWTNNNNWMHTLMFLTALEGILLFPIILLKIYSDYSGHHIFVIILSIIAFIKILTFFKCWIIFFFRFSSFFHFILYLCALELTPMLLLYGLIKQTGIFVILN